MLREDLGDRWIEDRRSHGVCTDASWTPWDITASYLLQGSHGVSGTNASHELDPDPLSRGVDMCAVHRHARRTVVSVPR